MRSRPLIVLLLVSLLSSTLPVAHAEPHTQQSGYLVPNMLVISRYCGPGPHTLAPHDWPVDQIMHSPDAWLRSGEPECAVADARNTLREAEGKERIAWGTGAAFHEYDEEDTGSLALAWADDAVYGTSTWVLVSAESDTTRSASEGCSLQSLVLPEPWSPTWPYGPSVWLSFAKPIGVDDELTVCGATTGVLHGIWGN